MRSHAPALLLSVAAATALAGCGTTERSGSVGDKLAGGGLEVTVEKVDRSVPVPERDVTGLATPARGFELVGVRVRACSNHAGGIGPYDFGIDTGGGGHGRLKYPERNYASSFDSFRDSCGHGWIVFEVPAGEKPARVRFGFEDTGQARQTHNQVDAEFSWKVG